MRPARSNGKHPGGRPSKYDPAYCQQLITFCSRRPYSTLKQVTGEDGKISFVRQANDPPLLIDFARKVRVHLATLYDWERAHPEFHEALEQARELLHKYFLVCGTLGLTNPTITALVLKTNHGYKDRNGNGNGNGDGGDTHYHFTSVRVEGNREELARELIAGLSRRAAVPAAHA